MFAPKALTLLLLVALSGFAMAKDDEPTVAPELCKIVCPKPLPDETIVLASPNACDEYCHCSPRGAILMKCPVFDLESGERLWFNDDEDVLACDWPENVDCNL